MEIHRLLVNFAAGASEQVLVSWHVSETRHLWRSVALRPFALAVADGTIDWSGVGW
jgi:hypothetical protein